MNICTRIFTATEESFSGDIRDWSLSKERIIKPYRKRGRKTNKIVRSMEISESSSTSRKRQRGEVEAIPEPQGSNQSLSLG